MVILTAMVQLISNKPWVVLGLLPCFPNASLSSPRSVPPLTPFVRLGTSKTRLATPSTPGGIVYSGPRNGIVVTVSLICRGCSSVGTFGR
ncbi:hypothetical protein C8R42DRAFT_121682 [Lentinula raphanica]|nr:hypothetical protein C8R42DRAFT_121682 [Lentinula raphanica]